MKLYQIQQLASTIDQMRNLTLPGKLTYAFYRNKDRLIKAMEAIEKTRIDMLKKYADLDEKGELVNNPDGNKVQILPEKESEFNKEFTEFMSGDSDVKLYHIPYSLISELEIEGRYMETLQYMIEEPEEFKILDETAPE